MSRKSKKTSGDETNGKVAGHGPGQTTTDAPEAANEATNTDRDQQGRFTKGNAGGPGNPHARHCARMLALFRDAITDDEMYRLCRVLFEKATSGDVSALKMIWQYKIGKPLPAP